MLRLLAAGLLVAVTYPLHAQTVAEAAPETPTAEVATPTETAPAAQAAEETEAPAEQEPELTALEVAAFKLNSAQDLIDLCALPEKHPDYITAHAFCIGFVTGTVHYQREIAAAPGMRPLFCPDRPIPRDRLIATFLDWSNAHPGAASGAAVVNIIKAASAKWPCRG